MYLVVGWKHNLVLLNLEQLVNGGITNNFKKVLMDNVFQYGLLESNLVSKLISFGVDGISIL